MYLIRFHGLVHLQVPKMVLDLIFSYSGGAVWPWLATKGHEIALLPLLPLGWGGEWKEKAKKLVDLDRGSLTEQQTK